MSRHFGVNSGIKRRRTKLEISLPAPGRGCALVTYLKMLKKNHLFILNLQL